MSSTMWEQQLEEIIKSEEIPDDQYFFLPATKGVHIFCVLCSRVINNEATTRLEDILDEATAHQSHNHKKLLKKAS